MQFSKISGVAIYKSADGKSWWLEGIASDTSVDYDGDKMSPKVLQEWANKINTEGVNVHGDHKHGLFDSIGIFRQAEVRGSSLIVRARLEDPEINPQVKQLLHKLEVGERVGLSIGADLQRSHTERSGGQPVRVIDEAPLHEISVVGIPANPNAQVLGVVYKSLQPGGDENDPNYSGAYVGGQATDGIVQPLKPRERFLTNGVPDRDKLLQTRTPMQPEAKIAAEPGKSGSSEVFRTDLGQKFEDVDGYEPEAKLEDDGHMYLPDGSHSAKCDEWDTKAQESGRGMPPVTKGNVGLILQKGDIYIVNSGQPTETTDGLGEGPVETAGRIYGDSRRPEMNPTAVKPTRSPTSSPISRDTWKTEESEKDDTRISGNPKVVMDEDDDEDEFSIFPNEASLGTDLRLAPKKTHVAR